MTRTLAVQAYEQLRQALANGDFEPGAQLVNRTVAKSIGMSMTPIREAVNRLASEGLLEQLPGAGAFVRRLARHEFAQLYDVREALEPLAAAHAAALATPLEIAELRTVSAASLDVIRCMRDGGTDDPGTFARWRHLEARFHAVLVDAARNAWLSKVVGDLKLLTTVFARRRELRGFPDVAGAVQTWRDHRRLIRAVEDRDGARAATLMRSHIRVGRDAVLAVLSAVDVDGVAASSGVPDRGTPDDARASQVKRARRPKKAVRPRA